MTQAQTSIQPFIRDPQYQPVTVYDSPDIFITQLMDGEASFRSFFETFIGNDAKLSAVQRDSWVEELKQLSGDRPVTNAFLDIATNPFVWLGFLTTPGIPSALGQGGRAFTAWARNKGVLPPILSTGAAMFDNTPVASVIRDITDSIRRSQVKWQNRVGDRQQAIERFFGLKPGQGLDPRRIADPVKRRQLEKLKMASAVKLHGWDKDILRQKVIAGPGGVFRISGMNDKGVAILGRRVSRQGEEPFSESTYRKVASAWQESGAESGSTSFTFMTKGKERTMQGRILNVGGRQYFVQKSAGNVVERRSYSAVPKWLQDMDDGQRAAFFREVDDTLDAVPGAREWVDSVRTAMHERYYRMFFKEVDGFETDWARIQEAARRDKEIRLADMAKEAGQGSLKPLSGPGNLAAWIDEDKVTRLHTGLKTGKDAGVFMMFDALDTLIDSPSTRKALLSGNISREKYARLIRQAAAASADLDGYMPRNVTDWYARTPSGVIRQAADNELWQLQKGGNPGPLTASGRAREITGTAIDYAPDDLRQMGDLFGSLGRSYMDDVALSVEQQAFEAAAKKGLPLTPFRRIDATRQISQYEAETARDIAMFVDRPSSVTTAIQEEIFQNINPRDLPEGWVVRGNEADRVSLMQVMDGRSKAPIGGWSNALALEQGGLLVSGRNPKEAQLIQKYLKETFLPAALGTLHHDHAITRMGVLMAQRVSRAFADGPIGRSISESGDFGRDLIQKFRFFGDPDRTEEIIRPLLGNTAGYLYSTHLGLNVGSVLLNMQQPWLHTATLLGSGNTLAGWKDATNFLRYYFKNRPAGTFRLTPSQRSEAVTQAVRQVAPDIPENQVAELVRGMGITDDFLEQLDSMALQAARDRGPVRYMVQDVPMKAFEKVEWLNRATAAFGLRRAYLREGRALDAGFVRDATRFIQETQFGSDVLNTPAAFMRIGALANPLVRQFQTFALRAPLAFLQMGPRVNNGMRRIRGTNVQLPWYVADPMRALGVSAVVYELGKNLFNVDLSQGGVASSVTEFAGLGERFLRAGTERTDPSVLQIPAPPAFSIAGSFAYGFMGGDKQLIGEGIARLFPGGIAFQRALGMAPPEVGGIPLTSIMQKTYADWYNPTPDGSIPVYKADGTLMDYRNPHDLILRAFGADFGRHRKASNFDYWLSTQREEIIRQRNDYINALLSGRGDRARRIKDRFEKKFGFPLTVTKEQLRRRIKNQGVARPERILDRMPSDAKPLYAQYVAQQGTRTQVPQEAFMQAQTSTQRDALFQRPEPRIRLTPQELEMLRASLRDLDQTQRPGGAAGFVPFGSF